ncbi:AGE family epimerase/isomerase [Paraburkholderia bonniea]|uniref:AGE family epimerase/isomerase n=1 Tax=Paraburkholderia bonniea TaxID=2152891 RepID=UPI002572B3D0|nr:AGE family epimerase/isomerase [Paraburkholderia bonniea]WJF91786.1 AGE family epimerase/isomerase [Paraburkholderia bonniea]WJF95106.1 AGE family epimerase/isomerase [Paraburkholderia bonniea]
MTYTASPAVLADALRAHFARVILPLWRGPGFNPALQLPYEALGGPPFQPLPPVRYRAMACARQLFVFSQAGDSQHAHTLFDALQRHFADHQHGGWLYSVDAHGTALDTTKDLYTHAFVVFACAEYFARFGNAVALTVLQHTSGLIESRFAAPGGLFHAALDAALTPLPGMPLQNPLMHLTEAWLAAHDATRDSAFEHALSRLGHALARTFVHVPSGCIAELPVGSANNRLEPGHQFEWFWLVRQAGTRLTGTGLDTALEQAFDFAQQHGVDPVTGGVCAALDETGSKLDDTQRIWAQSEYLRALACRGEAAAQARLPQQIEQFRSRFLLEHGWIECRAATGEIIRTEMPSTTPYHLATAYAALPG